MEQQPTLEMKAISDMLDVALEFGFELEVIYFALKHMKENPTLSPVEAFALGVSEWVK
jgi:hypothetical protein